MECNNAIMDLETIEKLIEMKENQLYLDRHDGKIWQGKNGFWYTHGAFFFSCINYILFYETL